MVTANPAPAGKVEPIRDGALPKVAPPVERKSEKVGFWNYAKDTLILVVVAKASAWIGYAAGRFVPNSFLPKSIRAYQEMHLSGKKFRPVAAVTSTVTGLGGAFYVGWRHWRKNKSGQLNVKDIHTDLFTELDPKLLQSETGQNQRIQDGIKSLTQSIKPRGSYAEAALQEPASGSLSR